MILKVYRNNEMLRKINKFLALLPISIVKLYQIFISPLLPNSCRFYPSCSNYSIQAFQKYGFIKGLIKSVWRILRCNPFNPGGHDPA